MTQQTLEPLVLDGCEAEDHSSAVAAQALERPYAAPLIASFALDSLDLQSGDALTANG